MFPSLNPETDGRIFSPHTFVKAGGRWHVRGYCEKIARDYRDLVLSRFRGEAVIEGTSAHTSMRTLHGILSLRLFWRLISV